MEIGVGKKISKQVQMEKRLRIEQEEKIEELPKKKNY